MLDLPPGITLSEADLQWAFTRSAGPGGQNVNKVSTAVELRIDLNRCTGIPYAVRERLRALAGHRLTADGILRLEASRHRSQGQNREEALAKLCDLLLQAAQRPKKRIKTRASAGSRRRRAASKARHSQIKRLRGSDLEDE